MENDNTQDKKDKLRTLLLDLNAEQMAEYYRFGVALEEFTYEMRCKFVEKQIEGMIGWESTDGSTDLTTINSEIIRITSFQPLEDINLANWAFIYWYRRNKSNISMKQYAVYLSPSDYSGKIVVREWLIVNGVAESVPRKILCIEDNYHDAISYIPLGTVKILPQEGGDECLLETWI